MQNADLLIKLGGDTTLFDQAIDKMRTEVKAFETLVGKKGRTTAFSGYAEAAGKAAVEFNKMANAAKISSNKIRQEMAKSLGFNTKKLTATQKKMLDKYEAMWNQSTDRIASRRLKAEQLVFKRQMINARRVAARNKREADKVAADAQRGNNSQSAGSRFTHAVGTTALYGAVAQALFGLQAAYRAVGAEVIRFDQSIYSSMAVLQKTKAEGKFLALEVEKLSIAYGTSANDIQGALLTIGRAGVDSTKEVAAATEVLTQLAKITGDSMSDGAAGIATMLSVYPKLSGEIHVLGEKMSIIANATRLGLKDFTTISNYALTTAKSIGINADSYLALAGAMSKVGLNASTIGTSIRRLKKFTDSTSKSMQVFFRVLGQSQGAFSKDIIDSQGKSLIKFSRALADMDPTRFKLMTQQLNIFEKATIDTFRAIGENDYLHLMKSRLERVTKETNNLAKQAKLMSTGLADTFSRIGNTIKSSFNKEAINILDGLFSRDDTDKYAADVEALAQTITSALTNIAIFAASLASAATAVGLATVAIKVWNLAMTAYTTIVAVATGATIRFNKAMMKNIVIAALTIAMIAYLKSIEKTKEKQAQLANALKATREEMELMSKQSRKDNRAVVAIEIAKEEAKINTLIHQRFTKVKSYWGLMTSVVAITEKEKALNAGLIEDSRKKVANLQRVLAISHEIDGIKGNRSKEGYGAIRDYEYSAKEIGAKQAAIALNDTINGQINKRYAQYVKLLTARNKEVTIMNKLVGVFGLEGDLAVQQEKAANAKLNLRMMELKVAKELQDAQAKETELARDMLVAKKEMSDFSAKMATFGEQEARAQDEYNTAQSKIYQRFGLINDSIKERVDYQIMATDAQDKENELTKIQIERLNTVNAEMERLSQLTLNAIHHANSLADTYASVAMQIAAAARELAVMQGSMTAGGARVLGQQSQIDDAGRVYEQNRKITKELKTRWKGEKDSLLITQRKQEYEKALATEHASYGKVALEEHKMKVLGQTLNTEALKHEQVMTREKIKQNRGARAGLTGKAKAIQTAKDGLADAQSSVHFAKQLMEANKGNLSLVEAYAKAKTAVVSAEVKLNDANARKDPKGKTGAANAAAREHNRIVNERINMVGIEMAKKLALYDLANATNGVLLTRNQANLREIEDAKLKVRYAKEAWEEIKKQTKLTTGKGKDKARKKEMKAEILFIKAKTNLLKKQQKTITDFNKKMRRVGESFADSLLSGDIKGAFQSLFKDIVSVFTEPLKDSFSDLFGDTMTALFGNFYKSLVQQSGDASKKVVADKMQEATAGAVSGVVNQSNGEPYSAFGRMAVMAAIMAALGLAVGSIGGGGGGGDFKYQDVDNKDWEKGADITGIMEHMDWAMTRTMRYSGHMLDNLQALVRATGQAARGLIASGYTFNAKPDTESSGFLGFSTKASKTHEQGLRFGGVNANQLAAMKAYLFEAGEQTKTKWWGMSSKTSQWYKETAAPDEVTQNIIRAYQSGIKAVMNANDALQMGSNDQLLKGFYASTHKINFQGMSQDDIADAISGAIGSDLDRWVRSYAGWVDEFAEGSETALETYMRVAYEFEASTQIFADLGANLTVFGRQGVNVSQAFLEASGGLQSAIGNVEGYVENFYTENEKQKLRAEQIMRGSGIIPEDSAAYMAKIRELTRLAGNGSIDASTLLAEMLRQQQLYFDYYEVIADKNEEIEAKREEALAIQQENMDREMEWQNTRLSFYKDIEGKITSAYTGTLSYLNMVEKADFMAQIAQQQFEAGDTQGYFDSLGKQLEYEKKMALTKEEYALQFDSYISELQNAEPEKTTDDVVQSLEDLLEQNRRIEDAIANSSFQKTF